MIALLFTDLIIGLHSTMIFTTGSVIIIGLISNFFNRSLILRLFGALTGAIIFYLVTNFGVWLNGYYGYTAMGLVECYTLALAVLWILLYINFIILSCNRECL